MPNETVCPLSPVLFIPHGGGPLPLLGHPGHDNLVSFLQAWPSSLKLKPSAIIVISAHWEADSVHITSHKQPALIYDYYGFPDAAYQIQYPVPGNPLLAEKIFKLLEKNNIPARLDPHRGFDHGVFVPLKLMFPATDIPCVQLSLVSNLDPQAHIQIGKALAALREDNILVLGSGFSFHNLNAFFSAASEISDIRNQSFEQWLIETCCDPDLSSEQRQKRLIEWSQAPFARYCHPREEHLLPLQVCAGFSNFHATQVFSGKVLGKNTSAFLWDR